MQLNPFEPLIIYNLMGSIRMLTSAIIMLNERCIAGISANRELCEAYVKNSIGIITVFSPYIGYENASRIAQLALVSGKGVVELIEQEGLLDRQHITLIMSRENLTGPSAMLPGPVMNEIDRGQTHLVIPDEK